MTVYPIVLQPIANYSQDLYINALEKIQFSIPFLAGNAIIYAT